MGIRIRRRDEPKMRTVHPIVRRETAPLPLRVSVLGLAGVAVVATGALVVVHLNPGVGRVKLTHDTSPPHASVTTKTAPPQHHSIAIAKASTIDGPKITALSPATTSPGARVTVVGVNFFAADGSITATVSGTPVPTVCPTEQRCIVTIPRSGRHGAPVPLVVDTPAGRSNSVSLQLR